MGAIKAKLETFKAPKAASSGRRGSVKQLKPPPKPAKASGGGGSKMSPTSMFYLGRTMKRDQEAKEMGEANSRIAVNQQGAALNNAAAIGQTLQQMNDQLDALLGLGQ